jgi:GntR family transcriptional regulator
LTKRCNTCHSTAVVPFRLNLEPGTPIHEQVVFAAKKAIISGKLRSGDAFPSVRALSRAMKIHANTAQKVVAQLTAEGLLEVRPGIGTVIVRPPAAGKGERARLLGRDVEQLTVEAMKLGLGLDDLQAAVAQHWKRLKGEEAS